MKRLTGNSVLINAMMIGMTGIMVMLAINRGVFMHTHKIGDNKYISHSHPYNKSNDPEPYKSHHHTKEEFLFFQNIEILFPFFFLVATLAPFSSKRYFYFEIKSDYKFVFFQPNRGRAPPVS